METVSVTVLDLYAVAGGGACAGALLLMVMEWVQARWQRPETPPERPNPLRNYRAEVLALDGGQVEEFLAANPRYMRLADAKRELYGHGPHADRLLRWLWDRVGFITANSPGKHFVVGLTRDPA